MNEIFHRTSIRKYQNKSVEDDKIEKMLQAVMAAPSAGNQQPWEFYVVKDKTTLEKLSKTLFCIKIPMYNEIYFKKAHIA